LFGDLTIGFQLQRLFWPVLSLGDCLFDCQSINARFQVALGRF